MNKSLIDVVSVVQQHLFVLVAQSVVPVYELQVVTHWAINGPNLTEYSEEG